MRLAIYLVALFKKPASRIQHFRELQSKSAQSILDLSSGRLRLEVMVVSPGGVATTSVIRALENVKKVNSYEDSDGLKHIPSPHSLSECKIPVLYIYDDAGKCLASLVRRGFDSTQALKLANSKLVALLTGIRLFRTFQLLMLINRQKRLFLNSNQPNILPIGYEDLWNSTDQIAKHLGVETAKLKEIWPEQRPRKS